MCDVPFHDNFLPLDISKDQFEDFSEFNEDSTSIDDDSFSIDDIKYVEASPPDSELISLEVMEIVISEVRGIDEDILLTIKDDNLREKLLNINLLIANIKALKDNPTQYFNFMNKSSFTSLNFLLEETSTFDNSLPKSETFCFNLEEISSGSTTTRADISLPDYKAFYNDSMLAVLKPERLKANKARSFESSFPSSSILSEGDAENASVKEITLPNEVTDLELEFPNPASQSHTCGAKDYRICEGFESSFPSLSILSEGDAENASVKEITVPNEVTDLVLGFPNPASQSHTCGAKDYITCE
nr:DNA-directed RNA polymerase IV subunit 1 isoform X1 [Tanacetum cinerariifolium]